MTRNYPRTRKDDQVDDFHGTPVHDPYRWLEQPANTPEVRAWIEAQNEITRDYFEGDMATGRIRTRLRELWDFPKFSVPNRRGGRYFQMRNSGLQNQNVLYVMEDPRDEGRVLLDPNTFSDAGRIAINMWSVRPDGKTIAYATSEGGSDWITWRFRDIVTGEDLPDRLEWVKFSYATWHPDSSGVFYQRFPEPSGDRLTTTNEAPRVVFHRLGTEQDQDELVYERPEEPEWMFHTFRSDDDRYLLMYISRSTEPRNLLYFREMDGSEWRPIVSEFANEVLVLGNDSDTFYLQTDEGEGRGKVVSVRLDRPEEWQEIVPESEHLLHAGTMLQDEFLLLYQEHATHRLRRIGTDGQERGEVQLPGLGSVAGLDCEREHDEAFFTYTSFIEPTTPYRFDLRTGETERLTEVVVDFDASRYEVQQEFATSKDGTRVPYFRIARKGLELNGGNPALLYGYGGFNISLTPSFSPSRLAWLEEGGVLAVANLRGGGEYGRDWHEAGTLERKQNVFDDFIACAEHLIETGVTRSNKLAIQGGSNGGLLVGACMIQRPDLFGAVNAQVGVLDMLRYHLFTVGSRWASDFGRADNPEHFPFLHAYSPLHNVEDGTCYPSLLITTGDHDDRVVPAHSFKFAARMQEAQGCDDPILLRVETRAGHGMGKPTEAIIEEHAQIYSFFLRELGVAHAGPERAATRG